MELNKIYELMTEFKKSGISKMKIKDGDFSISLSMPEIKTTPAVTNAVYDAPPVTDNIIQAVEGEYIYSPIVGTFYEAPGEDMEPFVNIGQTVKKGQNVCIVEAMKMMNEIAAPYDCIIEEILVENDCAVGYNEPLFRIRGI